MFSHEKLEDVPIVAFPCPNRTELAAKVCKEMVGVLPPEEVTEPDPVTEVTPPMVGEVVATTMPLLSNAKNFPALGPSRNCCPVVVALVRMEEEALRVVSVMPDWAPGRKSGIPVAVQYSIPIRFTLK